MSTSLRIAKNTTLLSIGDIIIKISSFIYLMFGPRYLGTFKWGALSTSLAFGAIFENFLEIGLNQLIIRDIARNPELAPEYLFNTCWIRVVLGCISLIFVTIFSFLFFHTLLEIQTILILWISNIFYIIAFSFYAIFQACEKMEFQSLGLIISNTIINGGSILLIFINADFILITVIHPIANGIMLVYCWMVAKKRFQIKYTAIQFHKWGKMLKISIHFFIGRFSTALYSYFSYLALSALHGSNSVALYDTANRIVFLIITFYSYLFNSFFPAMVKLKKDDKIDEFKQILDKIVRYLSSMSILIAGSISILATFIISFLYGSKYEESILILQILAWRLFFFAISSIYANLMYIFDQQRKWMIIVTTSSILSLISSLFFIQAFNIIGAAIISLTTEALVSILLIIFTKNKTGLINERILLKIALLGTIAILFQFIPIPSIITGICLFLVIIIVLIFIMNLISLREIIEGFKYIIGRIGKRHSPLPGG
ncbi:MAG: flippase [Candidatus Sigynarchaeota archaeon]